MDVRISNLERDGERRPFAARGQATLASAGGLTLMRARFEPGWRWSNDVRPIAGTESCQTHHLGYVLAGTMQVRMDDGTEQTLRAGDMFDLPAGHDAWIVGDEACEALDFSPDATRYARPAGENLEPAEDAQMATARRGYAAFNTGDMETLRSLMSRDVVQHVPGNSQLAGAYKGIDGVLAYYGKLAELTNGTMRADLIETFGDRQGHVVAVHQATATRNGATRVSRQSLLFTFLGDKVTDILELRSDLPGDDAFFA
jgi:ketosteroid isomerase-like protein